MSPRAALTAAVITVSDRVSRAVAQDRSGPLAAELLAASSIEVRAALTVPDEADEIISAVRGCATHCDVVVLTGGTGLGPRDITPDAVEPILDRRLPGLGEAMRAASRAAVPTADLSRAFAGSLGSSFVLALPGSPGGVRDGLAVALPLIPHAVEMIAGSSHGPGVESGSGVAPERSRIAMVSVTAHPLSVAAHEEAVDDPSAGAIVSFSGVVRDHDGGREVAALEYEAHPTAEALLNDIAAEIARMPGVVSVAVSHRFGPLSIGEVALAAAVSSAHRAEAFAACARLIDEVKERIPVWKRQVFADGTDEWVNSA